MNEYRKIVILEAVYDDSDLMTDYFNRDAPVEKWFICDLPGKAVTEQGLRMALSQLPAYLQAMTWEYQKGEKYSMSDHYYGQLRMDKGLGVEVKGSGGASGVGLIISSYAASTFEMNHKYNKPIPKTLGELQVYITNWEDERKRRSEALKPKILEAQIKTIQQSSAVIDGRGFHVLTKEDKTKMIADLQKEENKTDKPPVMLKEIVILPKPPNTYTW